MTRFEKITVACYFALLLLTGAASYMTFAELRSARLALDNQETTLAGVNFVSSGIYTLSGGGAAASDTSLTVDNFLKPVSETHYTMASDFGSIGYLTLDPGSATNKEFVSFTSFSYSGNRATFTGVTRGLEFNSPYTASSTLRRAHSGGSRVIVSNPPQLYNQLATKQNDESITGIWNFASTTPPRYDLVPTNHNTGTIVATTSEFASVKFVQEVAASGCLDAAEGNQGCVELATAAEAGAGTSSGSDARLVLPASLATSTPTASCSAFCIVVATAGKIVQGFIDLTTTYLWSGLHTFSAGFISTASSTVNAAFTITGNTTLSAGILTVSTTTATSTFSGNVQVSGNATTTNLTVSGTCTGCLEGYERIETGGAMSTGSGQTTTIAANCSAGKKVLGGGFVTPDDGTFLDTSDGYMITKSYASDDDTWSVSLYCATAASCDSGYATSTAVCVVP